MLKVDRDYVFDTIPDVQPEEYIITPNDQLQFRLFANDGYMLIELSNNNGTGRTTQQLSVTSFNYVVEKDSMVNLPILGRIALAGLTLKQAEDTLETRYSQYYNSPFVMLNVGNRRVFVFPGNAGNGQVVTLQNNNTTLIEVLAQVGGLAERGKADNIRVIRKEDGDHKVFNINLSTIDGVKDIDMIIQANDLIYVEPAPEIAREVLKDVAPLITLFNTGVLLYLTITSGLR